MSNSYAGSTLDQGKKKMFKNEAFEDNVGFVRGQAVTLLEFLSMMKNGWGCLLTLHSRYPKIVTRKQTVMLDNGGNIQVRP